MTLGMAEFHGRIFDQLIDEHRQIVAMFDQMLAEGDAAARAAAYAKTAHFMRAHSKGEEEIVYPALDGSRALHQHIREDQAEHRDLEARMQALDGMSASSPTWETQVRALRAAFAAHVADEENVLFPQARTVFGDDRSELLLYEYEMDRDLAMKQP